MMKTLHAASKTAPSTVKHADRSAAATLYGISSKNSVQIKIGENKMLGTGHLYALIPKGIMAGTQKFKRVLEHITPGYVPEGGTEENIRCICRKTGKPFRFIGRLRPVKNKPAAAAGALGDVSIKGVTGDPAKQASTAKQAATGKGAARHTGQAAFANRKTEQSSSASPQRAEPSVPALQGKCPQHAGRQQQEHHGELAAIGAARKAGLDSSLKIHHVCALVQESRSSIYRKIQLGKFPTQIKREKGSFWLLSHIELYMNGKWTEEASASTVSVR